MIDRNEFQQIAKQFRAGKLSLSDFTNAAFDTGSVPENTLPLDENSIDLRLPVRPSDSHKGDFGRVLLIGGSVEMPGAIALSAMAALRAGSGLAAIMTPDEAWRVVAGFCPCVMTAPVQSASGLFASAGLDLLLKKCEWADVVAIGPGMGRSKGCQEIVAKIYQQIECPVVLDADGLNNLGDCGADLADHRGPRILTPHAGELLRLIDGRADTRRELEENAVLLAQESQAVVLLKGPKTLVTDGKRAYHNTTGNAGMATAGSGDVLTGIISSLVGQKMDVFESAQVGAYLHGMAGDLYAQRTNSASMLATDLVEELPRAMAAMKHR